MVVARIRSSERLAHLIKADQLNRSKEKVMMFDMFFFCRFTQKMRSERSDWNVGLNARFQTLTEKLVKAIACGSRGVVQSEARGRNFF